MDKVKTEEKQITPDLDRIMQDGRPVFPGAAEPAADEPGPVIIGHPGQEAPMAAEAEPEQPAKPASAAPPPSGETPAAGASPETPPPAVAPPEPDGKGKEPPRGDYRFKTLVDADKAYRLLQGEKTRVELRLKTVETELDGAKAERERSAAAEAADKDFLEKATERNKQALAEINDLNPDDPEYTTQAAECWARANLDIRRLESAAKTSPPGKAGKPSPGDETGAPPAGETPDDATLVTRTFVGDVLEGANLGIPKDDPLFWTFAEKSPSVNEDGTPIPMKDQIWWAVERTLNYRRANAPPGSPAELKRTPVSEEPGSPPAPPAGPVVTTPMGRSGAFRHPGGDDAVKAPVSLADTLDSVMEMRRL